MEFTFVEILGQNSRQPAVSSNAASYRLGEICRKISTVRMEMRPGQHVGLPLASLTVVAAIARAGRASYASAVAGICG
jgi:hypothetical protein